MEPKRKWVNWTDALTGLTRSQPDQGRDHDHGVNRQGSKSPLVRVTLNRNRKPDRADDRYQQDDPDGEYDEEDIERSED